MGRYVDWLKYFEGSMPYGVGNFLEENQLGLQRDGHHAHLIQYSPCGERETRQDMCSPYSMAFLW